MIWIEVYSATGDHKDTIQTHISLELARADLSRGACVVTLPGLAVSSWINLDDRLAVYRHYSDGAVRLVGETIFFVRSISADEVAGTTRLTAYDPLYLLEGRVIPYAETTTGGTKTAPRDTILKQIWRENLGALAGTSRDLSAWLTIDDNSDMLASATHVVSRSVVLNACQDICRKAREGGEWLTFDAVVDDTPAGKLRLAVYLDQRGVDRRASSDMYLPFGAAYGNVAQASYELNATDEVTASYAVGSDGGIMQRVDLERASRSPFGLRETLATVSSADSAILNSEAGARLDAGRPRDRWAISLAPIPGAQFGRDFGYGDLLSVETQRGMRDVRITGFKVTSQAAGEQDDVQVEAL